MAILQISRITQRKGVLDDLPEPLAGAEFGWAVDQRRLFIGNGELAEGAPVVGNTEILTEFSDVLALAGTYTYSGLAATGYAAQTGPTSGDPVSQSLQNWFDQFASVKDFGATGDGVTDDTAAINRALFQLYCRQNNTQIRRALFFPAGTYLVTDSILIPPYAKLYGEGSESSIIRFEVDPWVTGTPYATGVMVFYSTNGLYYRALSDVPVEDGDGNPILPTNALYWDEQTLPEYVVRTADSLQQTGNDISSNGASRPTNVEVSSMAFKTLNFGNDSALGHDILLVEDAEQVSFRQCSFDGPFTTSDGDTSADDLSAVRFASTPSLVTRQVVFDDCKFSGCTYGFNTDQQVEAVTISNSYFTTLTKGVVLGSLSPVNGGPTGFRIVHNIFDDVYSEGIVIQGVILNATGYNIFLNVANGINASALAPVIDIDANNNISVGDMFQRTTSESATWPRVSLNDTTSIALGMNIRGIAFTVDGASDDTVATEMQLGKYTRTAGVHSILANNDTENLFVVDTAVFRAFKMDYTIIRGTAVRTGSLVAVSATTGTFSYTDDYSENTSTGITFSVTEAAPGGDITVAYTSTNTGTAGTIDYSIVHLA